MIQNITQKEGMNGDKMDMNDKRKPEEGPRNNNTGLDTIEKNTKDQKESSTQLGIS
jgi:hypothetical protein